MKGFLPISKEDMQRAGLGRGWILSLVTGGRVCRSSRALARPSSPGCWKPRAFGSADWPSPTGGGRTTDDLLPSGPARGLAFLVTSAATSIRWSLTTPRPNGAAARTEYSPWPQGGAAAPTGRRSSIRRQVTTAALPAVPVDHRRAGGLACAALPTTTTGTTRFARRCWPTRGRILLSYGMGENQTIQIARRLAAGEPVASPDRHPGHLLPVRHEIAGRARL